MAPIVSWDTIRHKNIIQSHHSNSPLQLTIV
ncbi:unnamed protein product [Spirodela intermedia]|uniref:Uncharacterized protein n=1 Tax=Spirodela intermedia TaxID=51605 RepID=A0A7I8KMW8_SPIIN|nr:unnamed protein product [Spirodela intermedia]